MMTDFWNGRFKVFMVNMGHIMAVDTISFTIVQNLVPIIIMHTYQICKNTLTEKNHNQMF
jgi:hypothetical protein